MKKKIKIIIGMNRTKKSSLFFFFFSFFNQCNSYFIHSALFRAIATRDVPTVDWPAFVVWDPASTTDQSSQPHRATSWELVQDAICLVTLPVVRCQNIIFSISSPSPMLENGKSATIIEYNTMPKLHKSAALASVETPFNISAAINAIHCCKQTLQTYLAQHMLVFHKPFFAPTTKAIL